MNRRRYGRLTFVGIGVLALAITASALSSRAQQGASFDPPPSSGPPVDLSAGIPPHLRMPHAACDDCFTVADTRGNSQYDIFEEVPGTGQIIKRSFPNPAPLEPDEERLEFDPETGLPIWYIGRQPYVGPTDLEPFSSEYPRPLIELKRIHIRHEEKIMDLPGVHGFGIGQKGFVVYLDPKDIDKESLIPFSIEEVPVEVELREIPKAQSHQNTFFAPVPSGSGIGGLSPGGTSGTLGPHIVRTTGSITRIHSLTATHVVKFIDAVHAPDFVVQPPVGASGSRVWGFVIRSFQLFPVPTINNMWQRPDVAVIENFTGPDNPPHTSPNNSNEPIRKLQYKSNKSVNGPSGIIINPGYNWSAKLWGAVSDAPKGRIKSLSTQTVSYPGSSGGTIQVRLRYVCDANYERPPLGGDSGALVTGNGSSNRHVYGIHVAAAGSLGFFILTGDIVTALSNSGFSFQHFWGTASGRPDLWDPALTQCDGSC